MSVSHQGRVGSEGPLTAVSAAFWFALKAVAPAVPVVVVALPCSPASPPQPARDHCSSGMVVAEGWKRLPPPGCMCRGRAGEGA